MDIRVLGALTVTEGGASVVPAAAAPRQVLALLAAFANQAVPVDVLVKEAWPDDPPRQARVMLQAYVAQLRELLATALRDRGRTAQDRGRAGRQAADILADVPGGYRLGGCATSDVWQFERAVGAGYRAMATGDLAVAARRLREALALWRGEPFADVAAGPHLAGHVTRLCQSRERALGQWVEAELRLGRHRELTTDLITLWMPRSLREQLLAVLHRCADQPQALTAYLQLRQQRQPVRQASLSMWAAPDRIARGHLPVEHERRVLGPLGERRRIASARGF